MTLTIPTTSAVPRTSVNTMTMPLLNHNATSQSPFAGVLLSTLTRALTVRRQADGSGEAAFVAWLASHLPVTMIDGAGNLHVDRRGATSRTLFTAHTDTVHRSDGANAVRLDNVTEPGQTFWRADGAALGADDGAGVALMAHMIGAGVPGYYVFFRGEECGGVGSKYLANTMPELLQQFDRAVAFDRAGYYDVITHQAGGRCCSDAFAQALADQINDDLFGFMMCPEKGGVYTDTAEFIGLIPECTNVSVGYFDQHGDREKLNVTHLVGLAAALVNVQWEALPTERPPTVRTHGKMGVYQPYDRYADSCDPAEYVPGDENAEATEDALLLALDGYLGPLIDAMNTTAAQLYAMTPLEAGRYLNRAKLTDSAITGTLDNLMAGVDADIVLSDLYDECC